MIELSYNTEELVDKIFEISEGYPRVCFIQALADIFKDLFRVEVWETTDNAGPDKTMEYKATIGGNLIRCNFCNSSPDMRTRSGEGRIETSNGAYIVKMGVLIKLDEFGKEAHMKKVSLDVLDVSGSTKGVGINYSLKRDLLGGVSTRSGDSEAEFQRIIDGMWKEIMELKAERI